MGDGVGDGVSPLVSSTFAVIKPDAMRKKLAGAIITRIEHDGFTIAGMQRIARLSTGFLYELYAEHRARPFFEGLCAFMQSGPVILLELQREDAVAYWRKVLGATDPREARRDGFLYAGGKTLRDLYGNQEGVVWENVAHGSDSDESAKREIAIWRTRGQ